MKTTKFASGHAVSARENPDAIFVGAIVVTRNTQGHESLYLVSEVRGSSVKVVPLNNSATTRPTRRSLAACHVLITRVDKATGEEEVLQAAACRLLRKSVDMEALEKAFTLGEG